MLVESNHLVVHPSPRPKPIRPRPLASHKRHAAVVRRQVLQDLMHRLGVLSLADRGGDLFGGLRLT